MAGDKKFRTMPSLLNAMVFILAVFVMTLFGSGVSYGLNHSGNIASNQTWYAADNPHAVTGNIQVYNNATLTIEAGCQVRFYPGTTLYFGYSSGAALKAVGTSGNPITFTSNATTPAPGDWMGVVFFNHTDDTETIMDYCTVEYGGNAGYNSNVYCNAASPTVQRCVIRNSDGYGIHTTGSGSPSISCSTITNNTHGVYAVGSANPTVVNCNIHGNTYYGIYMLPVPSPLSLRITGGDTPTVLPVWDQVLAMPSVTMWTIPHG